MQNSNSPAQTSLKVPCQMDTTFLTATPSASSTSSTTWGRGRSTSRQGPTSTPFSSRQSILASIRWQKLFLTMHRWWVKVFWYIRTSYKVFYLNYLQVSFTQKVVGSVSNIWMLNSLQGGDIVCIVWQVGQCRLTAWENQGILKFSTDNWWQIVYILPFYSVCRNVVQYIDSNSTFMLEWNILMGLNLIYSWECSFIQTGSKIVLLTNSNCLPTCHNNNNNIARQADQEAATTE